MPKWIFITGGVLSGLGKGLLAASLGKLLQSSGYKVIPIKCDGYLNVDSGTIDPFEHGEVFILEDGGEVDMDFGHYERFLSLKTKSKWNITSGKILKSVIDKERKGDYSGKTVQLIPHVTDEIKKRFRKIAVEEGADLLLVEIGGTVGDYENKIFLEAARQLQMEESICLIHITLVPYLESGELKTKPTQHSVNQLERSGLRPDIIVGRSSNPLTAEAKEKISKFCYIKSRSVISNPSISNLYRLPLVLHKQNTDKLICEKLDLSWKKPKLDQWKKLANSYESASKVTIGICGNHTNLDSYASVFEALKHAAGANASIKAKIAKNCNKIKIEKMDGIVILGIGNGKMKVAKIAREKKIPLLGVGSGFKQMLVEYARNRCGLDNFIDPFRADLRPGASKAKLAKGSKVRELYGKSEIKERRRNRYEMNPSLYNKLESSGLLISGFSKPNLAEFVELPGQFWIATQAHPEFKSRPGEPSPIFKGFIKACLQSHR